jgi:hypothetical protein
MKKYPDWTEFPIEETGYGLGAPFVGIGVYTLAGKFSWPDPEGTMKKEYEAWVKHLADNGYEVPEGYLDAYVKETL